jgi:hypothetical protein
VINNNINFDAMNSVHFCSITICSVSKRYIVNSFKF